MLGALVVSRVVPVGADTRLEIGPVVSSNRIHLEGDATGRVTGIGAFVRVMSSRWYGVEFEATGISGRIEQSYTGTFVAYPPPGVTPSSPAFSRYAPVARRMRTFDPGFGGAVAFGARRQLGARVSIAARAGAAVRSYAETSRMEILTIPEGIDRARVASDLAGLAYDRRRTRGGLLLGVDLAIRMTARLRIAPVASVVIGPEQVGNVYRESSGGVRLSWTF